MKVWSLIELFHYRKQQAVTFMTCCLLTQRRPLFSSQEHTATCSHFHASATVILTQHRPVTHFPLVAWAFKLYPVACEGSACYAKRYLPVIALLLAECLKSERQDILHVEDMGVFTSTAVQTSLICMNPLFFPSFLPAVFRVPNAR